MDLDQAEQKQRLSNISALTYKIENIQLSNLFIISQAKSAKPELGTAQSQLVLLFVAYITACKAGIIHLASVQNVVQIFFDVVIAI